MERTDRPREGKGGALPEEQEGAGARISLFASQWEGMYRQPLLRGKSKSQTSSPCLDLGSSPVYTGMVGMA